MAREAAQFNSSTGGKSVSTGAKKTGAAAAAAVSAALNDYGGTSLGGNSSSGATRAPAAAQKPSGSASTHKAGILLPPQLRGRRNVTTEDISSMRTAKRPKPSTDKP